MPQLHRLDGRAPADAPPRLPSLRPCDAAAQACPECGEEDSLVACGPGVERIADEVAELFPEARTAIVTSDTIWSPLRRPSSSRAMEAGEIDIVIGTQLVTKGYHFPNLTLVGVVDADLGLAGRRPARGRAQLPADPAGRRPRRPRRQAGPGPRPDPRSRRAGDRRARSRRCRGFYAAETEARREAAMPPFGRLAAIIVSAEDQAEARGRARRSASRARGRRYGGVRPRPRAAGDAARPPSPAPAGPRPPQPRRPGRDPRLAAEVEWSAKVAGRVDVDPYSFL